MAKLQAPYKEVPHSGTTWCATQCNDEIQEFVVSFLFLSCSCIGMHLVHPSTPLSNYDT